MTWPAILFWSAIASGFGVAWWMWRIAVAMRSIEQEPTWRGCTRDE